MIEEAAAMTNQTMSQFMLNSASERAAEIIDQHRRIVLNDASCDQVMDASGAVLSGNRNGSAVC